LKFCLIKFDFGQINFDFGQINFDFGQINFDFGQINFDFRHECVNTFNVPSIRSRGIESRGMVL
jgi:hypothetical protein